MRTATDVARTALTIARWLPLPPLRRGWSLAVALAGILDYGLGLCLERFGQPLSVRRSPATSGRA